ncbi:transcriptional activator RinB [Staphylococcus succinus]|nr:transcriptional activator RinB [Staphylococcus succinus]MBU0437771.1 transcriptional activator RinB [Staphylococcus succinus]
MKTILKTLLILTVYELTKYVTEQIIAYIQANDDIDQTPIDYEIDAWKRY